MRKVKVINIEGRGEVMVKEVSPLGVWNASKNEGSWLHLVKTMADDAVSPSVATISTWYPSEIEQVVDAFLDINSSFFALARKLKVDGLLGDLAGEIATSFQQLYADSSQAAMAQLLGDMAGASSSTPSNTQNAKP